MQIFVDSVERLNSPVYSAPPCMSTTLNPYYVKCRSTKYSGPCNSFYCLGHSKNVYDDDDNRQKADRLH